MGLSLALALGAWAIGAVISLLIWRYAVRMKGRIEAARGWPRVRATITRSQPRPVGKGSFMPGIVYRYEVGGKAYDGHRLTFGNKTGNRAFAEEVAALHPVGQTLEASYDPDNPGFAVLTPTGDPKAYLTGAGLVALLSAFTGVVLLFVD